MRHIIMREGEDVRHSGRIVELGALTFPDRIPVVWMSDYQNIDGFIGIATDIRRVNDGYVTAEITFNHRAPTDDSLDLVCYGIYASHLDLKPNSHRVLGGTVRSITTMLRYTSANASLDGSRGLAVPWADMKASDVE
jgi:hypothetical protein